VAGALERGGQPALVLGTRASLATRLDASAVGKIAPDLHGVFVIDERDLLSAERTDFAASEVTSAAIAVAVPAVVSTRRAVPTRTFR
jgi:hypothetical protein